MVALGVKTQHDISQKNNITVGTTILVIIGQNIHKSILICASELLQITD